VQKIYNPKIEVYQINKERVKDLINQPSMVFPPFFNHIFSPLLIPPKEQKIKSNQKYEK
jgi:hypothetical protein